MNVVDGLDGVKVVKTRVETDLVHDGDTSLLDLALESTDSVRDVRGGDDVDLVLASGLDDSSMVDVRDERDDDVVALDDLRESSSVVDVDSSGSGVVETFDEALRVLDLGRGNSEAVLGETGNVLGERLGDVTGTKEEDLLGSTLSLGSTLAGSDHTARSRGILLENLASKLGDNEGSLVDLGVVVSAVGDLTEGNTEVVAGILGADDETNLTGGVGGDGGESVVGNGEELLSGSVELTNEVEVDPDTLSLGGNVSSGLESLLEECKVGLLEESLGGADRVRGVGDDDIEGALVLGVLEELEAVTDDNGGLGVGETLGHVGKVLLGDTGDSLVNVTEDGLLDGVVLDNLTENTTVTTADNENTLRVGVGSERNVGNHLLVGEFVTLGSLDDTVKDENVAEGGGLEDEDILEKRLLVVEDALNLEAHGLTGPLGVGLGKTIHRGCWVSEDDHFWYKG